MNILRTMCDGLAEFGEGLYEVRIVLYVVIGFLLVYDFLGVLHCALLFRRARIDSVSPRLEPTGQVRKIPLTIPQGWARVDERWGLSLRVVQPLQGRRRGSD